MEGRENICQCAECAVSNIIHSPNNNNQNTPVDVARNHTASYVRPVLNSRSIISPTPSDLPTDTQRQVNQTTVVQQSQQQSTNNNNISIPQQTQPLTISQPSIKQLSHNAFTSLVTPSSSTIKPEEFAIACDVIRELDALTNKKHNLENEQENKSFDSHESLNKKGTLDNNSIDLGYDNPPKDYDKEPSFEELYESIRKLNNTMKNNMNTGEAAKETEENHHLFRTHAANSSNLDYIGSALSKSA
nr:14484_t:CDS:2 [Entrophospora candida]